MSRLNIEAVAKSIKNNSETIPMLGAGPMDARFRDGLIKKIFKSGLIEINDGKDDERGYYVEISDSRFEKKRLNDRRFLRLYYDPNRRNEIVSLDWTENRPEGILELKVSKKEVSGSYHRHGERYNPTMWRLEIDNTGRINDQEYLMKDGKRNTSLLGLSRKDIKQLKKAGLDNRLVLLSNLLLRDSRQFPERGRENLKRLIKTDVLLMTAAALGIPSLLSEVKPDNIEYILSLTAYGLMYFFNQGKVIKNGTSEVFRSQRKLALEARDMQLYFSSYLQWLKQIFK